MYLLNLIFSIYVQFVDADRLKDEQLVRSRLELRKNLKCRDFKWYLGNVWPQQFMPMDGRFFGKVFNCVNRFFFHFIMHALVK